MLLPQRICRHPRCRGPAAAPPEAKVDVHAARLVPVEARHHAAVALSAVLRQFHIRGVCHERVLAVLLLAQEVVRPAVRAARLLISRRLLIGQSLAWQQGRISDMSWEQTHSCRVQTSMLCLLHIC